MYRNSDSLDSLTFSFSIAQLPWYSTLLTILYLLNWPLTRARRNPDNIIVNFSGRLRRRRG